MYQKIKNNLSGQGIVEVMVAIGIVTVGLTGTLALTSSSLRFSGTSKRQIVAANLSREGVEVVRNIRDSNWLQGNSWLQGLTSGTDYDGAIRFSTTTNTWRIDFTVDDITDNGADIRRDSKDVYQSVLDVPTGTKTGYRRFIYMQLICEQGAARILRGSGSSCPVGFTTVGLNINSRVDWVENDQTKSFILEDNVYNWR